MFANARGDLFHSIETYMCLFGFVSMDSFINRAFLIYLCPSQLTHGKNNGMS